MLIFSNWGGPDRRTSRSGRVKSHLTLIWLKIGQIILYYPPRPRPRPSLWVGWQKYRREVAMLRSENGCRRVSWDPVICSKKADVWGGMVWGEYGDSEVILQENSLRCVVCQEGGFEGLIIGERRGEPRAGGKSKDRNQTHTITGLKWYSNSYFHRDELTQVLLSQARCIKVMTLFPPGQRGAFHLKEAKPSQPTKRWLASEKGESFLKFF